MGLLLLSSTLIFTTPYTGPFYVRLSVATDTLSIAMTDVGTLDITHANHSEVSHSITTREEA